MVNGELWRLVADACCSMHVPSIVQYSCICTVMFAAQMMLNAVTVSHETLHYYRSSMVYIKKQ